MIGVLVFAFSLAAAQLNLKITAPQTPVRQGSQEFEIRFEGQDSNQLKEAQVTLEGNMAHPGMVPTYGRAREIAPGVFKGRLELTMAGDWRITAVARLKGGEQTEAHLDLTGVK